MGLLFDDHYSKRIPTDNYKIHRNKILEIGSRLGFTRPGARIKFEEKLRRAKSSGLTREEVHQILQELILEGYLTRDQAMRMARELGLEDKRYRYFSDVSESRGLNTNQSVPGHIETGQDEKHESLKETKGKELYRIRHRDREAYKARQDLARLNMKKTPDEKISGSQTKDHYEGRYYGKLGPSEEESEENWRKAT